MNKNYIYTIIKILIISAVVYYLAVKVDFVSAYYSAINADKLFLVFSILLLPVNIIIQFYKWKLSCRYYLSVQDNKKIWRSLFAGFSAGIFTPARSGEYLGRGIPFPEKRILNIAYAVFIDKVFTLVFILLFGAVFTVVFFKIGYGTLYFFTIIMISVIAFPTTRYLWRVIKETRSGEWISKKLKRLKLPDINFTVKMMFASLLFYTCYITQFAFLIAAFTSNSNIILYIILAGIIIAVKTLVPNLISGELGIRESASVFFLTAAGQSADAGFNASIFLFLINIAVPAAAGIFFFESPKSKIMKINSTSQLNK